MRTLTTAVVTVLSAVLVVAGVGPLFGEKTEYPTLSNRQMQEMLDQLKIDLQERYYDPTLHGFDLDKKFNEAREKLLTAKTQDDGLLIIAAAVAALKDSHTNFSPPARPYHVEYGFVTEAVGDTDCYVTAVREGSDAAAKGLKVGDEVIAINGVRIVRSDLHAVQYGYRVFPQSGFHLDVRPPDGQQESLTVMSKVTPGQKMISSVDVLNFRMDHRFKEDRDRYYGMGNQSQTFAIDKKVLFWKLPTFVIDPEDLASQANKAREFETVVLDLRGNHGGRVDALDKFVGEFFERDVKIADQQRRDGTKEVIAKGRGNKAIQGKLIVLVDSVSASAAEIFPRVMQLEKRGTILGDRSAGAVMESTYVRHAVKMQANTVTQYAIQLTVANLIMTDGKSLEGVGVIPDERVLPTAADLAAGRDPVLARAAVLAGVETTPEKAGKMFIFKWPEEQGSMD